MIHLIVGSFAAFGGDGLIVPAERWLSAAGPLRPDRDQTMPIHGLARWQC
jgi:hypothetical protein